MPLYVVVTCSNLCTGGGDGMDAIRQDLESAVAAATTCEDEARVAIPIAEKASHKEESRGKSEDADSVGKEEFIKPESIDLDKEKTLSDGADSVGCTEMPSEAHTALPDEVQKTKDEIVTDDASSRLEACGEVEVATTLSAALSEVEVSSMTADTCAEVEVSTSTPEDVVKSEMKKEPMQVADDSSKMTKVSNTV
jgi:hypothetical protein